MIEVKQMEKKESLKEEIEQEEADRTTAFNGKRNIFWK